MLSGDKTPVSNYTNELIYTSFRSQINLEFTSNENTTAGGFAVTYEQGKKCTVPSEIFAHF